VRVSLRSKQQRDARVDGTITVPYAAARRSGYRLRWLLLVALVLSPVFFLVWVTLAPVLLLISDGIMTTEPVLLRAGQEGIVVRVFAEPGAAVSELTPLIDIDSTEIRARLKVLREEREKLLRRSEELKRRAMVVLDSHAEDLKTLDTSLNELADKFAKLQARGMQTMAEMLQLDRERRDLLVIMKKNQLDYLRLDATGSIDSVSRALRELDLEIASEEARDALLTIRASNDGAVNDVFVSAGEFVQPGELLAQISNLSAPVVNVYLQPKRMDLARVGRGVTILLPNGDRLDGEIVRPPQLTQAIPPALAGPFEEGKPALKVVVKFLSQPRGFIEGLPVRVSFRRRFWEASEAPESGV